MKIEDKKLSFYCDWTFINFWLPEGIFSHTFSQFFLLVFRLYCCYSTMRQQPSVMRICKCRQGVVLEVFMGSLIDIELLFHFHDGDDAPCSTNQFHLPFILCVCFFDAPLVFIPFVLRMKTRLEPHWRIFTEQSQSRKFISARDFSMRSSETLLSMPYIFSLFSLSFPFPLFFFFYFNVWIPILRWIHFLCLHLWFKERSVDPPSEKQKDEIWDSQEFPFPRKCVGTFTSERMKIYKFNVKFLNFCVLCFFRISLINARRLSCWCFGIKGAHAKWE